MIMKVVPRVCLTSARLCCLTTVLLWALLLTSITAKSRYLYHTHEQGTLFAALGVLTLLDFFYCFVVLLSQTIMLQPDNNNQCVPQASYLAGMLCLVLHVCLGIFCLSQMAPLLPLASSPLLLAYWIELGCVPAITVIGLCQQQLLIVLFKQRFELVAGMYK